MTKGIKKSLLFLLTSLLLFTSVFFVLPKTVGMQTAKADTTGANHGYALSNAEFEFGNGAYFNRGYFSEEENGLGFKLKLLDPGQENLLYHPGAKRWRYNNGVPIGMAYYDYYFTIHRVNKDGETVTPIARVSIRYGYVQNEHTGHELWLSEMVVLETLTLTKDIIHLEEIGGYYEKTFLDTTRGYVDPAFSDMEEDLIEPKSGKTLVKYGYKNGGGLFDETGAEKSTLIWLDPESVTNKYFISFDYDFYLCGYTNIFWSKMYHYRMPIAEGTKGIATPARSFYDLLYNMNEVGDLEEAMANEEQISRAQEILNMANRKNVKVNWLEPIPDTPFARLVSKTMELPVLGGITMEDVCATLGVGAINVYDSAFLEFRQEGQDSNEYTAYYLPGVWLRSMTSSGYYQDYYLDINQSYRDFFEGMVEQGVIDNGLYEWYFGKMIDKYPKLSGYQPEQVYGYFGFAVLPQDHSISDMFTTVFDKHTTTAGMVENFSFDKNLSYSSYMSLLNDFGYNWLSKIWATVSGFKQGAEFEAKYYLFYSLPGTKNAFIGEGGQTNPQKPESSIQNELAPVAKDTLDQVKDTYKDVLDSIGNVSESLKDTTEGIKNATKMSTILVYIIIAIIAIYFIKKISLMKNTKKKK